MEYRTCRHCIKEVECWNGIAPILMYEEVGRSPCIVPLLSAYWDRSHMNQRHNEITFVANGDRFVPGLTITILLLESVIQKKSRKRKSLCGRAGHSRKREIDFRCTTYRDKQHKDSSSVTRFTTHNSLSNDEIEDLDPTFIIHEGFDDETWTFHQDENGLVSELATPLRL